MGASLVYLDRPNTNKETDEGLGPGYSYAVSSMQGWRINMVRLKFFEITQIMKQEDAHICNPSFDINSGIFGVFDGHGGIEIA